MRKKNKTKDKNYIPYEGYNPNMVDFTAKYQRKAKIRHFIWEYIIKTILQMGLFFLVMYVLYINLQQCSRII